MEAACCQDFGAVARKLNLIAKKRLVLELVLLAAVGGRVEGCGQGDELAV